MSLVFAGHIPNDPHLIAETTHPNSPKQSSVIAEAVSEIEGELYFMKPDTVIFLTEHQAVIPEAVNMHITPQFQHTLFTGATLKTDALLTSEIKATTEVQQRTIPLNIIAEPMLDDRIAAPLGLMMRHVFERTKIIVFSLPELPAATLLAFGDFLKREIMRTERRVALFSTGHIALCTTDNATSAQSLESVIAKTIEEKRPLDITKIQSQLRIASQCDGLLPLTVLFACLKDTNIKTTMLARATERDETSMVINCILQ